MNKTRATLFLALGITTAAYATDFIIDAGSSWNFSSTLQANIFMNDYGHEQLAPGDTVTLEAQGESQAYEFVTPATSTPFRPIRLPNGTTYVRLPGRDEPGNGNPHFLTN